MTMTALKTWANGDLLLYTEVNAYIGSGGNLAECPAEKASAAGQIPYASGSKAIAMLTAGTSGQVLHSGTTPSWGKVSPDQQTSYHCRVFLSAANQTITNNTETAIDFDGETSDLQGWHSTSSNKSRITPTTAGWGLVMGAIDYAGNATGARHVRIRKNAGATPYSVVEETPGQNAAWGHTALDLVQFNGSTDYVELCALQVSGGDLDVQATAFGYRTWFGVWLLGT